MINHNGRGLSMKCGIIGGMHESDARVALIREWLSRDLRLPLERLEPASSDASFRRYFRAFADGRTYVVMDAPPGQEDVRPYLKVSGLLADLGAHVPQVHEADAARGLLLLEDLGTTQYLERLQAGDDPGRLYRDALSALANIQLRGAAASLELPPYDEAALARELALMPEWFLRRHLMLTLTAADEELLAASFAFLIREALAQPAVFVHRDYHSRNLMVTAARNPGVIDFQDALRGPVGYDLVSLLKDCYIDWPRERVVEWVAGYRAQLAAHGGPAGASDAGVPALVRSGGRAAPPEGARDFLPPVVPGRQARLPARSAAYARLRARHLCALRRACAARTAARGARRGAAARCQRAVRRSAHEGDAARGRTR